MQDTGPFKFLQGRKKPEAKQSGGEHCSMVYGCKKTKYLPEVWDRRFADFVECSRVCNHFGVHNFSRIF